MPFETVQRGASSAPVELRVAQPPHDWPQVSEALELLHDLNDRAAELREPPVVVVKPVSLEVAHMQLRPTCQAQSGTQKHG